MKQFIDNKTKIVGETKTCRETEKKRITKYTRAIETMKKEMGDLLDLYSTEMDTKAATIKALGDKMDGMTNLLLLTDSYKVSHKRQYPFKENGKGGYIYSYFESRGAGKGGHDEISFVGLQYFMKRYLEGNKVVTELKIQEAEALYSKHFGAEVFDGDGWRALLDKYKGALPIRIMAVPEGTVVGVKNVLFTMVNTDPKFYWLTNFLETLLVQVWYPMTVASNSRAQKKVILSALEKSGTPTDAEIAFKLHDFGCRGVSSMETAGLGCLAHLTQFNGTDTVPGLDFAQKYYKAEIGGADLVGMSIPASEHSTMTSWGRTPADEMNAYKNMLEKYPMGKIACVIDAYNMYFAAEFIIGKALKKQMAARKDISLPDGKVIVPKCLVVRPDSGTPMFSDHKLLEVLFESFKDTNMMNIPLENRGESQEEKAGYNDRGYKVLDSGVRVIQGDGIDYQALIDILDYVMDKGWSADNIAFGSGGGLLQKLNRDTQKCAFKASHIEYADEQEQALHGITTDADRYVFKEPIDQVMKKSKKGKLALVLLKDGTYTTIEGVIEILGKKYRKEDRAEVIDDQLTLVFENGEMKKEYTFKEVRKNGEIKKMEEWDVIYKKRAKVAPKKGTKEKQALDKATFSRDEDAIQKATEDLDRYKAEKEGITKRVEEDMNRYLFDTQLFESILENVNGYYDIALYRDELEEAKDRILKYVEDDEY